ncbi:ATP-binding protein [Qingshengfaniella alkalisoli]|uniref:histidine kinase n=1 Tax=Qingshengfaniella alkalisoli TaxID=2599296 RepID=A0A5B8I6J6_9RHOB|nr:ATP-binding protein [Qingshengfaniella alkalisoli]QDY69059.1 PAS domain-containing protein [Qingshengfaniella alkalisoli]
MTKDHSAAIMSAVPLPLVLIGEDERILNLNEAAEQLFGTNMEGRHFFTIMRQPDVLDCIADAIEKGTAGTTRYHGRDHAQNAVYRVRCVPLREGGQVKILVSFEDITPLEAAGQMRRDFVANVSHELRTPLTALLGFIETLRGPAREDADARDRFLSTMEREAGRMNRLVNELLTLSHVESEERVKPTDRVDLTQIIDSVIRSLRPMADAAEVDLQLVVDRDASTIVTGETDQLVQVFTNLTENALKYGADGDRVELRIAALDRDPVLRAPAVRVDVKDFGAGIEARHLHRLTERFYRADSHRSRALGGTGLGLAIVKHIVNRHRGRLKIDSTPGEGSCFSVIFPAPAL